MGDDESKKRGSVGAWRSPKKQKTDTKKEALLQDIVSSLTCAISHEPIAHPVLAEDGHLYEKADIKQWLAKEKRSPRTNKPMGTRLVESINARDIVEKAVNAGLVEDEAAASWHIKTGKLKAQAELPGGACGAMRHFQAAFKLNPSPTAEVLMEAADLRHRVDCFLKRAADVDVDVSSLGLARKSLNGENVMTEWRPLTPGVSRLRIIDDLQEFEYLCNRPAPGAEAEVMYCEDMECMRGATFTLDANNEAGKSYELNDYTIPFDACILVSE